jgi:ferrous iron transport protein B
MPNGYFRFFSPLSPVSGSRKDSASPGRSVLPLAVVYGQDGTALMGLMAHQLDWGQAYSFMLYTLLYTSCLSSVATPRSESKSVGFTALATVWALVLAWFVGFVFYQGARTLSV